MSPDSAAPRGRRRRWLRRVRILVEGLALGGNQILLVYASGWLTTGWISPSSLTLVALLSACAYLVASLIEGFLASSRTGKIRSGIPAAWLVAAIGVLPVFLLAMALLVIVGMTPPPPPCNTCIDGNNGRGFAALALSLFILVAVVWAWMLSTLGGWIGGMVGKRDASQPAATA